MRVLMGAGLLLGVVLASMAVALLAWLVFDASFWIATATMTIAALLAFGASSLRSTFHIIRDYPKKGDVHRHIAKWKMKNYDKRRPHGLRFARHALAIDETRADFPRVRWGFKGVVDATADGEALRFVQMWFAGNHSDIGGSYPEEESRLSDIALRWMVDEATAIPDPLIVDPSRLNTFPSPAGMQHCEVDAMRDSIGAKLPRWLRTRWKPSWKEQIRTDVLGAPVHHSVEERFALPSVLKCGSVAPYRPESLRSDPRFAHFYEEQAQ